MLFVNNGAEKMRCFEKEMQFFPLLILLDDLEYHHAFH